MTTAVSRRTFAGMLGAIGIAGLAGCSGSGSSSSAPSSSQSAASASGQSASANAGMPRIVVGTLATEDILPLWVARDLGLFDEPDQPDVEIELFQSATELIAGVASGTVDAAMTDPMVAASLVAGGTDLTLEWVTLGTTAEQGRFGIMVGPNSDAKSLSDLAGVPIGVGTNTILEYVMDRLMADAGIPDDQVIVEELQKLPVRFQAMMSGEVAAAALPGSLLALGEAQGCRTIADDTKGENISQSVMVARTDMQNNDADPAYAMQLLGKLWDTAVDAINADPESFRGVLVANANLSDVVADTYPICEYPHADARPTAEMVDPVLEWMKGKGYLSRPLSYNPATGAFE